MARTRLVALTIGLLSIFLRGTPIIDTSGASPSLGIYTCHVEDVYGIDDIAKRYIGATLIYDADAGTMNASFHFDDPVIGESDTPFTRLWSRLKVETLPSSVNHLQATQYRPVGGAYVQPTIAWLMIETLDNPTTPRFQFFSTGIRSIAVGSCMHA